MPKYQPGVKVLDHENRIFTAWGSVEVLDKQNDFLTIEDLNRILGIMEKRGANGTPITIGHSNAIVGHTIEQTPTEYVTKEGKKIPAVWLVNQIFKDYPIDDEAWNGIVRADDPTYDGIKFTGMSLGGRGKRHVFPGCMGDTCPTVLKNIQGLEWSLAVKPANQLAVICKEFSDMEVTGFDNDRAIEIAKAIMDSNSQKERIQMDEPMKKTPEEVVKDFADTLAKLTSRMDAIEKSLVQKESEKKEEKKDEDKKSEPVCKDDVKVILDSIKTSGEAVNKRIEEIEKKFANAVTTRTETPGTIPNANGEIKKELQQPALAEQKPKFKTPQQIMRGE